MGTASARASYRVLQPISYPTDPAVIERLLAGEDVPWEQRSIREVAPGEVVGDVPAVSVPWLLEQGAIEEAPAATAGPKETDVGDVL